MRFVNRSLPEAVQANCARSAINNDLGLCSNLRTSIYFEILFCFLNVPLRMMEDKVLPNVSNPVRGRLRKSQIQDDSIMGVSSANHPQTYLVTYLNE